MPYSEARRLMRPGDPVWTADRGTVGGGIRLLTGESVSHIGMTAEGWPDVTGAQRRYVAQANLGKGIHLVYASQWFDDRDGRVYWIQAPLTERQRLVLNAEAGGWFGCGYEGAWDFARQALGAHEEDGLDRDKVCSAAFAAWWLAATGVRIPGSPWLRFIPPRPGRVYVPSPGDVLAFFERQGCPLVEVLV